VVNYASGQPQVRLAGRRLQLKVKHMFRPQRHSGRLTWLNFGMGRKPNLCRPATGGLGRIFGGRGSTPYVCMHQLSAMFCTAVVAVIAYVKTLPEIAGETVDTAKKCPLASGSRRLRPPPEDGDTSSGLEFLIP